MMIYNPVANFGHHPLVTKFPLQKQISLWSLKISFWKMDFWNWCRNDEPITKQLQRLWYRQQALLSTMHGLCSVKLWYFFINCIDNRLYNIVQQVITFGKFYDIFHYVKICQHIFRDFYSSITCYLTIKFFFVFIFFQICFLGRCTWQ